MQVRPSTAPVQAPVQAAELPFQAGEGRAGPTLPLSGLGRTVEQTLAGMSGVTAYIRATNTSGSLRPTASHKTSGLTQMGRGTRRLGGLPGLQCHYLSCFLGRVLLQNLGLAAGEERGLKTRQVENKRRNIRWEERGGVGHTQ